MNKILIFPIFVFLVVVILLNGCASEEQSQEIAQGVLIVSGMEDGSCVVREINIWSISGSLADGARVVGKISNACPETSVEYYSALDLTDSTGRVWYKIESNGVQGWITDTFVVRIV